jgi:hypothetical protein
MTQQKPEQQNVHCLLCLKQVKRQGDVCPQCEPRYMALGKALIEYERQLQPIIASSSHKHITAPMRFVPDLHFYLKKLDEPIDYHGQMITYQLTVTSITPKGSYQRDSWYGHTIPSTLMAATINRDLTKMGFPEKPEYLLCPDLKLETSCLS